MNNETQRFDHLLRLLERNIEIRQRMIAKEQNQDRRQTMLYGLARNLADLERVEKESFEKWRDK